MSDPATVVGEITQLTSRLIELSLCNQQNYPTVRTVGSRIDVGVEGDGAFVIALRNVSYLDIYNALSESRAFNIKMVDGALIQMSYTFQGDTLLRHRLAFFPSPDLTEFQNSPDVYEQDEIYAEVIAKNVVPFPVRFDYLSAEDSYIDLHHPKSHMTLGQYSNCRVPVTAPLAPSIFIDFILRSFYNTVHRRYCEQFRRCEVFFDETISHKERGVIHFRIPSLDEVVAGSDI